MLITFKFCGKYLCAGSGDLIIDASFIIQLGINTLFAFLHQPGIEFLGEGDEQAKQELLGGALALLFPIDWAEPFGLAMIEAFACGTPVVAFDRGSVNEVVDDGTTGLIVRDVEEALAALEFVSSFDRVRIRQVFEDRFSAGRMADDYVGLYWSLPVEFGNGVFAEAT